MRKTHITPIGMLALLLPLLIRAEEMGALTTSSRVTIDVPAGVRIGSWLTQKRPDLAGLMYAPGLMWNTKSEVHKQEEEKTAILLELTLQAQAISLNAERVGDLKNMLANWPVTGRKPLSIQDPWLMQANAAFEPISGLGDQLTMTGRPDRVRVITAQAQTCEVQVLPGRWALDYLQACGADQNTDITWLIQPNGQVSSLNVADWNVQKQEAPAPGAWLWVNSGNTPKLDLRIANFIATQGVAQGSTPVSNLPLIPSTEPRNLPVVLNDWGMSGLLQTPSARSPLAGQVSITAHRVWPYTHTTLTLSPFDHLELGFRYTNISTRLYGPSIAGDQSYKDKSSDVKWRMLEETAMRPAVAVGLRDPGGTGLFAGEYVVASKRLNSLDMSLGLGWGYMGARGNLANPLRIFGNRFDTRKISDVGSGGTVQASTLFTGQTALFGGVQWHTPISDLVVKVELDGNDYKHEPWGDVVGGKSRNPLNWGLAWQKGPWHLHLGYERGQKWLLGLSLSTNLSQMSRHKRDEPPAKPVTRPAFDAQTPTIRQSLSFAASGVAESTETMISEPSVITAIAQQTGWSVHEVRQGSDAWTIVLNNVYGFSFPERIDRGMGAVHELAPENIRSVKFVLLQQGVPVSSRWIDRSAWARVRYSWQGERAVHTSLPAQTEAPQNKSLKNTTPTASVGLSLQQSVGGPDGVLYALNATAQGHWSLWRGAWGQATVNARLLDNFDRYRYTAPSQLPRVRTYIREYRTAERITVPVAQVNQLNQWGDGFYSLFYAGALESMFMGAGAEVMWRPLGERWALGMDMNRLAQRDFNQRLSLRDYRVTSGHLTGYWDTQWQGVEAKLMVGQYLAGDRGATFEVSRRFDNGARMGAWVTKTNVSSATFGEGSFDKGVYISIPFDAFLSSWSTKTAGLVWQPLIRDGGARLNKAQNLWPITKSRDEREWSSTSPTFQH